MHKIRFRTIRLIVALGASVTLAGCSGTLSEPVNENGFTEAQQSMIDAGPYIPAGSDNALRACSIMKQAQAVIDGDTPVGTGPDVQDFTNSLFNAQQTSYLAAEQSPRYESLYVTITSVDNAALDENWEAVTLLAEDAIQACQDMTVIDAESLSQRGIEITPGTIPNVN
jgi:hypothetical protein